MSDAFAHEMDEYWNEDGGKRWVKYIDRLEAMLSDLSTHLVNRVAPRAGEHILDIGCGGGPTSATYAAAVGDSGRVLGVDISAPILKLGTQRFGDVSQLQFELADAMTHTFSEATFDTMTSRFGVMFFPDPAAAFSNIRKAIKPGGRLCFMCWQPMTENDWMAIPAAAAFSVLPAPERPAPGTPGPFAFGDPDYVRGIVEPAGFGELSFSAVTETLTLGSLDETMELMTQMGPAAQSLREVEEHERLEATAKIRDALNEHQRDGAIRMRGSVWIVEGVAV